MNLYTNILCVLFALVYVVPTSHGIRCWICHQAPSNRDCLIRGFMKACNPYEGCENEVRYGRHKISITKRCKQLQACSNDQLQNSMVANKKFQCGANRRDSVCRCCCNSDGCNKDQLSCLSQEGNPKCRFLFLPNGSTKCYISMDRISVGTRCQFNCKAGYEVKGAPRVTCERRGEIAEWSEPVPRCERKPTCVRLYGNTIANGFVRCSGIFGLPTLGTACVFRCKPRYFMVNEKKRKTVSNYEKTVCALGKTTNAPRWTRKPPNCIEEMCPIIATQPNGFVACTNLNKLGSICSFSCSSGYQLIGQENIVCEQRTGMKLWDARQPVCEPKPCPATYFQTALLNSDCTDHNRFGSICSFQCRKGYYLADPIHSKAMEFYTTTCVLSDGDVAWSHEAPNCLPKKCAKLGNPRDGVVKCTAGEDYKSKCTFACTSLVHEIEGEDTVECIDDRVPGKMEGIWSHPPPKCQFKKCSPIDMEATDVMCNKGYVFRSTCTMSCKDGFHMIARDGNTIMKASKTRTKCVLRDQDVVWSKDPPDCQMKRCPELVQPLQGNIECTDTDRFGSVCSFSCTNGFEIRGESSLVCREHRKTLILGRWSELEPSCERRQCPTLYEDTISSNLTCTDEARFESECTIHCQPGYFMRTPEGFLLDRENTACGYTEEGMLWDTRVPSCQPKTCDSLGGIENGEMTCSGELIYTARCDFSCSIGYVLEGASSLTCDDDGTLSAKGHWSSAPPKCIPRKCPQLGYAMKTLTADCDKGRDFTSKCTLDCKPQHFIRIPGSDRAIHSMTVDCGVAENDEMKWSPEPAFCEPVSCPAIDIPTVYAVCTNSNKTNSRCTFTCPIGYDLVGNLTNKCVPLGKYDAKWRHPLPHCRIRTCLDLVNDKHTAKTCTDDSNYQSQCTFGCLPDRGLFMTYAESSTVVDSGKTSLQCAISKIGKMYWTGKLPKCHVKFCLKLRNPKNGRVKCDKGSKYTSKCRFSCTRGYELRGKSILTCQEGKVNSAMGSWSAKSPICSRR